MMIISERKKDCVVAHDVGNKREILLEFSLEFTQNDIPKEVTEMRCGQCHYLEINHVIYGLSDVVRQLCHLQFIRYS